ncbi:hypothetical protein C2S53_012870 [Perilla frutescens var. hirtella]|uniref:GTD-binding domain-containing protein n=1 Tax=Perilla frutescens var. hirtella TaxID=608512 RepID=A0AAD4NZ43_PERFH|nr:hypothetical protein C2S53_012870 [Perilla frutescens var. hirtella]
MDLRRSSVEESGHNVSLSIASALVSAVLEWMLMFMIFIDASFAYLVTRFARHYQLRIPCLLCSRLDHFLGNERAGFYWDLICHKHKSKISSLVLCQLHDNLVDVHGICESCFCSFASLNKSNADAYGLPYNGLAQDELSDEHNIGLSSARKCTCCNEQWNPRTCTGELFQRKLIDNEGADPDAPSSINHTRSGDVVREMITEKSSQSDQMRSKDADPRPHVEYSQIKDTSDTESEGPLSDTESASAFIREMETSGQESVSEFVSAEVARSLAPEKLIHPALPVKSLLSESEKPTYSNHNIESEASLGLGLEELNWQQSDDSKDVAGPSDLICFSDVHPSPNRNGAHSADSKQTNDATNTIKLEKEVHVECRETSNLGIDSTGTDELWKDVRTECQENSRVGSDSILLNEIQMDLKPNKTETSSQMDLGDAYRLAVGTRGRQLSGKLEQQRSITDRVSEDLKLLLSQISAARGLELSSNDMSPKVSANAEDFKFVDASGSTGMQFFQRRISLERNESNLSLDGSNVSEIEGESEVERLKRQVEHDKKILSTLYKELEEERSASAIATNQAMAMITRLQEEKAAFHMEALQCVRMMEEQAEYDGEALQNANVLLAEKEKQIQDFQFQLELYRNPFGDVPSSNDFVNPGPESEADELKEQIIKANCGYNDMTAFNDSDTHKHDVVKRIDGAPKMLDGEINTLQISLRQFDDEKQYILQCLKTLEEKLLIFTRNEVYSDMIVQGFSTEEALEASASNQPEFFGVSQENGETEKNNLKGDALMPKDLSGYENSQHENEEYDRLRSGQYFSKDVEVAALRHELSVINNRLEALEAEQNVIEHSINALEKGSEGFEVIQEIAARLHELHSAHILKRTEDST